MIVSSLSLNHPFGLYHDLVCVGDGGIMKKVANPIVNVSRPLERRLEPKLTVQMRVNLLHQK